jgi:hypothetical protein
VELGEPEKFDSPGSGHYCLIHFPANDGFVASALGKRLIEEGGVGIAISPRVERRARRMRKERKTV